MAGASNVMPERDTASPETSAARPSSSCVLLVAPEAFFSIAGTPINILHMCRVLTGGGHKVHLATLPLGQNIEMPGLVYHRVARIPGLNQVPIGFSFAKLAYDLLLAVETFRLLRRKRFAAVHAIEDAAFFAVPIARWFGVPAVMDMDSDICGQLRNHGSSLVRLLAVIARPLRRLALRRSCCALTVAGALTRLVRNESPGTHVFEMKDVPGEELLRQADPDIVERVRQELGLPSEGLIVYTGNFDRRQGVEILIEAMPLVLAKHPDSILLLVGGEPPEMERLRQLAASKGVESAVRPIGKRPVEQMPEFMTMASVLASPRLEPYVTPLKIYAYMASGRPIVATDLPTHTDVLDLNSAILTPPDSQGMADGIIRALDEPARSAQLGMRAKQLIESEHTYEAFETKLADVYRYVVAQGRGALGASSAE